MTIRMIILANVIRRMAKPHQSYDTSKETSENKDHGVSQHKLRGCRQTDGGTRAPVVFTVAGFNIRAALDSVPREGYNAMMTPSDIASLELLVAEQVAGVYMLILRGAVQYIGQSQNIPHRIYIHQQDGAVAFDAVRIIRVASAEERAALERELIVEHNPPFNYVNTERARELRGTRDPFNHPRSVRWVGDNYEHAKKLAARERRPLNQWLNVIVERLWAARGDDL